jgi:hypothetical protein
MNAEAPWLHALPPHVLPPIEAPTNTAIEARRAEKKLAGGVSHRTYGTNGMSPGRGDTPSPEITLIKLHQTPFQKLQVLLLKRPHSICSLNLKPKALGLLRLFAAFKPLAISNPISQPA